MKFWDDEKSITLTRCVVVAALIGSIAMTLGGPWVTAWFIAVAGLRPSTGLTATLLVLGYACAALAIGMLVSLYKFLRRIEKGEVFVPENVAALRRISWCCAGAAVLCLAAVFICYRPFAVLATQNPVGSAGTQDLPNSQLDRFLMKLSMGYPDLQSQIHILRDRSGEDPLTRVQAVADREALCEAIRRVRAIHIADPVYDYIARLTEATRSHPMVRLGISPRGALALCRCAKAAAFAAGRDFVLPEDAAELVPYVFGHRLMLSSRAKLNDYTPQAILAQVLEETPAPAMTERTL